MLERPSAPSSPLWPLEAAHDVAVENGDFRATSSEPWLRLQREEGLKQGAIVRIRYSTHYFDDPVRPILRFQLGELGFQDHLMPAAYEGAGVWVGRVPNGLTETWISPTTRTGPFDFRIESVETISWRFWLAKALASPRRMFYAISARLVGLDAEADLNLRWVFGAEPMETFASWMEERRLRAIPRPLTDWASGPRITFLIGAEEGGASTLGASCRSILGQSYSNWRVILPKREKALVAATKLEPWENDPRFSERLDAGGFSQDLICLLQAGDELRPHALACFVEHFERHPEQTVVYADDISLGASGRETPRFKPDWSPIWHDSSPYVGRAALFSGKLVDLQALTADAARSVLWPQLLSQAAIDQVGHIRRALFRLPEKPVSESTVSPRRMAEIASGPEGRVSVVIPTRDRADLLEKCLRSIVDVSACRDFEILVVDNDSAEEATRALFQQFSARYERFRVVKRPGPFNFSAICNDAVADATGDFVIFLNNDTEIVTPDWIEKLFSFARRPDIGAVGARLLFPDRRLQHVGITLGMGGVAGHFGARQAADTSGWWNANIVPHETSAVTAACLMVEKTKFVAVGGFDSVHLPVDLNDVDLCLRLGERGWRTICDSRVELIHHESASRGGGLRLQRVYRQERTCFLERWRGMVRDDPCFNPGLSLYAYDPQLG
ncbi:MAG: glycosyltransferase family 2 protein [Rhodoblastus sp.]|uniref:glycosyltransferase family 2 protein n=1 Tax=Rhodoblastus sp. TaxID=1962975 RepID=UPI003F99D010